MMKSSWCSGALSTVGRRLGATYWRTYVFVLTPLILMPMPLILDRPEARAAYGVCVMAVYWVTECLPLAVTALLPAVIFPLMGVMPASKIARNYIKDSSLLFIGGLMMAVSIENSGLHRRVALRILRVVGSQPKWIMFGFMLPTWLLSMWISNTATTAMMLPVAEAVLQQLRDYSKNVGHHEEKRNNADDISDESNSLLKQKPRFSNNDDDVTESDTTMTTVYIATQGGGGDAGNGGVGGNVSDPRARLMSAASDTPIIATEKLDMDNLKENSHSAPAPHGGERSGAGAMAEARVRMFSKALCLAIAFAANAGGSATLTGSPPNLVLKGQVDEIYRRHGAVSPITFTSWMIFGLPCAMLCFITAWFWLQFYYLGARETCFCCSSNSKDHDKRDAIAELFAAEYRKLGPIRFAEFANIFFFALLVCLWIFRESEGFNGWGTLPIFTPGYVSDSTAALVVAVLLFAFPSQRPSIPCTTGSDEAAVVSHPSLLHWQVVHEKFPWSVLLLLGGGFALADACQESGLSLLVGEQLTVVGALPPWAMVMLIVTIMTFVTEVTSNTAITTLFLPIIYSLTESLGVHPLYLMMPATLAASYAYMLPVATPPNAIIFAYGHLKVIDMAKAGFFMNLACILVVTMATNTWGIAYFGLDTLPWAITNDTIVATTAADVIDMTTL